jgi:hypothetical protein
MFTYKFNYMTILTGSTFSKYIIHMGHHILRVGYGQARNVEGDLRAISGDLRRSPVMTTITAPSPATDGDTSVAAVA